MERPAVPATLRLDQALNEGTAELTASGLSSARQDSQLLLLHTLGVDRTFLLAHPEHPLSAEEALRFEQLIARRKLSEPIQYITGEREFYGLRFTVTPDVLIPRPETEHLVESALERIPLNTSIRIADIGTGSGAIAVALAVNRHRAQITALDISRPALKVAQANAAAHGVADRIRFLESNVLEAVKEEQFEMIVSNPPYIADSERETLAAEVKDYEPATALFSGPTGLEIYERLIPQTAKALLPGGWLLLEIGAGQQLSLEQLLNEWRSVGFIPDLQGIPRVAIAQRPPERAR